jgi:hypothetical protein
VDNLLRFLVVSSFVVLREVSDHAFLTVPVGSIIEADHEPFLFGLLSVKVGGKSFGPSPVICKSAPYSCHAKDKRLWRSLPPLWVLVARTDFTRQRIDEAQWNQVFTDSAGTFNRRPNAFLLKSVEGKTPGTAMTQASFCPVYKKGNQSANWSDPQWTVRHSCLMFEDSGCYFSEPE